MNAAIRSRRIFILTAILSLIALPIAWYYFTQDYTVPGKENERGDFIEFKVSDVGFGASNSFTLTAYVHQPDAPPVKLGPVAGFGNRQMVAMFTDSGKWLDDSHYRARIADFQVDIRNKNGVWEMNKQRVTEP
ncbi:MAG: hypothetical protein SV239_02300 [Thermodesulfobacteriota bacterium]|jgi:hypothetical protein|nr:hypothetical protein [Thermodesulfobacteriota bacterium]